MPTLIESLIELAECSPPKREAIVWATSSTIDQRIAGILLEVIWSGHPSLPVALATIFDLAVPEWRDPNKTDPLRTKIGQAIAHNVFGPTSGKDVMWLAEWVREQRK